MGGPFASGDTEISLSWLNLAGFNRCKGMRKIAKMTVGALAGMVALVWSLSIPIDPPTPDADSTGTEQAS